MTETPLKFTRNKWWNEEKTAEVPYEPKKSTFNRENRVFDIILSNCSRNPKQKQFIDCTKKRIIVRAGRRGGKTRGVSEKAIKRFLAPDMNRVLYAAPTADQVESFWYHVCDVLDPMVRAGALYKNETEHVIERPGSKQRIRAKTAWNADTLRGDYADFLILDEWQLMNEDAWEFVGAPMLLDNNGDACFIYTPISLHPGKKFTSKANDPQHAAKMFKKAQEEMEKDGEKARWSAFHWTSRDNGYLAEGGLEEIVKDMTNLAYRQEIEAEDINEAPGAMWTRQTIEANRLPGALVLDRNELPMDRIIVGVDPSGSTTGDEAGIIVAGRSGDQFYVLSDRTIQGRPEQWGKAAIEAYHDFQADRIVAETNYGGLMVESTIKLIDNTVPVKAMTASRGKEVRAEPVSAVYEQGRAHHVGVFGKLENEMCLWMPGLKSPNRMDALVWCGTELMLGSSFGLFKSYKKQAEANAAEKADEENESVALRVGRLQKQGVREFQKRNDGPRGYDSRSARKRGWVSPKVFPDFCVSCNAPIAKYRESWKCYTCGMVGNVEKERNASVLHSIEHAS